MPIYRHVCVRLLLNLQAGKTLRARPDGRPQGVKPEKPKVFLITFCRLKNLSCLLAKSDGQTICLAQFLYIARGSFRLRENTYAGAPH